MSENFDYIEHQEERVRESARKIARAFRRMADVIERGAGELPVERIPQEVAHTVAWGVANAEMDGPARNVLDLAAARDAVAQLAADKKEEEA